MNKLLSRPVSKIKSKNQSMKETLFARYVIEVNSWSRDKLINTLTDLKMLELEKVNKYTHASRRTK